MDKEQFLRFIENKINTRDWLKIRQYIQKMSIELDLFKVGGNTCDNCKFLSCNWCQHESHVFYVNDKEKFKCSDFELKGEMYK